MHVNYALRGCSQHPLAVRPHESFSDRFSSCGAAVFLDGHDPCDIFVGTGGDDMERRDQLWRHNKIRGKRCYPDDDALHTGVRAIRPVEARPSAWARLYQRLRRRFTMKGVVNA